MTKTSMSWQIQIKINIFGKGASPEEEKERLSSIIDR